MFSEANVLLRVDMLHFLFPETQSDFPEDVKSSEVSAAIFGETTRDIKSSNSRSHKGRSSAPFNSTHRSVSYSPAGLGR